MQSAKRLLLYAVKYLGFFILGLSVSTLVLYVYFAVYIGTVYFGLLGFIMWSVILGGIPLALHLNRWSNDRLRRLKVITAYTSYKY